MQRSDWTYDNQTVEEHECRCKEPQQWFFSLTSSDAYIDTREATSPLLLFQCDKAIIASLHPAQRHVKIMHVQFCIRECVVDTQARNVIPES